MRSGVGTGFHLTDAGSTPSSCRADWVASVSRLYGIEVLYGISCGSGVPMVLPASCFGLVMPEPGETSTSVTLGDAS